MSSDEFTDWVDISNVERTREPDPWVTREGWTGFVRRATDSAPKPRSAVELVAISPADRRKYDAERIAHFNDAIVDTKGRRRVMAHAAALAKTRKHLLLNALAGEGKTTCLKEIGRNVERPFRRAWEEQSIDHWDLFSPVVPITMPPTASILAVGRRMLDFVGAPYPKHLFSDAAADLVVKAFKKVKVQLVIVDELHFQVPGEKTAVRLSNFFKDLQNQLPQTRFAFGGIMYSTNLLSSDGGGHNAALSQFGRRTVTVDLLPYQRGPEWIALLGGLQQHVVLAAQPAGDLRSHEREIFERTQGAIGPVKSMIAQAYAAAISDGSERISGRHLEETDLTLYEETIGKRRTQARQEKAYVSETANPPRHASKVAG